MNILTKEKKNNFHFHTQKKLENSVTVNLNNYLIDASKGEKYALKHVNIF